MPDSFFPTQLCGWTKWYSIFLFSGLYFVFYHVYLIPLVGCSHRRHFSSCSLALQLQTHKVYNVVGFSFTYPRRSHRTTSYPSYIQLTPITTFEEVLDPGAGFVHDSFDIVPFDQLSFQLAPFPYLSDVVGRLVSISKLDHLNTTHGFAKKQAVVISSDR
ncbi:hypothetical protein LINGRAHAP2_LOCUS22472 [Linum grandiflorum]